MANNEALAFPYTVNTVSFVCLDGFFFFLSKFDILGCLHTYEYILLYRIEK